MIELYLISVISSLWLIASILAFITGVGVVVSGIGKQINDPKEDAADYKASCKVLKACKPIFIISIFLSVFAPTKGQLYMIFGIGPIIDNIKESDIAKQLPDKTLQVLDKWCDSYLKNNKEKE